MRITCSCRESMYTGVKPITENDAFEQFPFMCLNQLIILKSLFWQIQAFPITSVAKAIVQYL